MYFNGSNSYLASTTFSVPAGNKTIFVVSSPFATANPGRWFDSSNGRLIFANHSTLGFLAYYDTDWHNQAAQLNGWNVSEVVLNSSGTSAQIYTNNVAAGNPGAYVSSPIGGTTTIGTQCSAMPGLGYFYGYIGELLVYDSALSATNRQLVDQYLHNRWGFSY
jgi:hypothetical protein